MLLDADDDDVVGCDGVGGGGGRRYIRQYFK